MLATLLPFVLIFKVKFILPKYINLHSIPYVLGAIIYKSVDRSPPVLRRCELKSCRLFVGEQPNLGWPLSQPVSPIQHRGRKPEAGFSLSLRITLLSPEYLLSFDVLNPFSEVY